MSKKRSRSSLPTYLTEKSDVVVVDFYGIEYNLHSKALSEASEFFRAILQGGGWNENSEGKITIKFEDKCHLFPEVVVFIYNGYLNCVDIHTICPLFTLADQLQIPKLTELLMEHFEPLKIEAPYILFCQALKHNVTSVMEDCVVVLSGSEITRAFAMHSVKEETRDLSRFSWLIQDSNYFEASDLQLLSELSLISSAELVSAFTKTSKSKKLKLSETNDRWVFFGVEKLVVDFDFDKGALSKFTTNVLPHAAKLKQLKLHRVDKDSLLSASHFLQKFSKDCPKVFSLEFGDNFCLDSDLPISGAQNLHHISCWTTSNGDFSFPSTLSSFECKLTCTESLLTSLTHLPYLCTLSLCPQLASGDFWPPFVEVCNQAKFLESIILDFRPISISEIGGLPSGCSCPSVLSLEILSDEMKPFTSFLPWAASAFPNVRHLLLYGDNEESDNNSRDAMDARDFLKFPNLVSWEFHHIAFSNSFSEVLTELVKGKLQCAEFVFNVFQDLETKEWNFVNPNLTKIRWDATLNETQLCQISKCFPNLKYLHGVDIVSDHVFSVVQNLMENCKQLSDIQLCYCDPIDPKLAVKIKREFPQLQFFVLQEP